MVEVVVEPLLDRVVEVVEPERTVVVVSGGSVTVVLTAVVVVAFPAVVVVVVWARTLTAPPTVSQAVPPATAMAPSMDATRRLDSLVPVMRLLLVSAGHSATQRGATYRIPPGKGWQAGAPHHRCASLTDSYPDGPVGKRPVGGPVWWTREEGTSKAALSLRHGGPMYIGLGTLVLIIILILILT
jgi:hypothetical protein